MDNNNYTEETQKLDDTIVKSDSNETRENDEVVEAIGGVKPKKAAKEVKQEKNSALKEFLSWILTFAAALLIALVLKNYVIINANVPTGSMENTILPGDDIFGFRLAYVFSQPKRGDIIIFKFPDDESEKYVKRVIGEPGDTVKIEEGLIYINGSEEPLEEDYLKEEWTDTTGPFLFEVPENSYLVLGDNRNESFDARYWENTYVTDDEIIGKAVWRYYPFNRMGALD